MDLAAEQMYLENDFEICGECDMQGMEDRTTSYLFKKAPKNIFLANGSTANFIYFVRFST